VEYCLTTWKTLRLWRKALFHAVNSLLQSKMIKCSSQNSATFRTFCTDRQTDRHTHTHTYTLSLSLPLSLSLSVSIYLSNSTHRNKFPPTCTDNICGGADKAWFSAHTSILLFHSTLDLNPLMSAGWRQPVHRTSVITCYSDLCGLFYLRYTWWPK